MEVKGERFARNKIVVYIVLFLAYYIAVKIIPFIYKFLSTYIPNLFLLDVASIAIAFILNITLIPLIIFYVIFKIWQ